MTSEQDEILHRFHGALVREIHSRDPEQLRSPFTVAEIYQNLVPYRTHRDVIGVEMSADYEHALLRLLAGEGDFLSLESRTARQEIREELESPNPNTGLYRDFAAADVRLNPDRVEEALAEAGTPVGGDENPGEVEEGAVPDEEAEGVEASDLGRVGVDSSEATLDVSGQEDTHPVPESTEGGEKEMAGGVEGGEPSGRGTGKGGESEVPVPDNCPWCRENLPERPGVRFCPFCGSNVRLAPCPECGEELELNWRFCIACGTEVAS